MQSSLLRGRVLTTRTTYRYTIRGGHHEPNSPTQLDLSWQSGVGNEELFLPLPTPVLNQCVLVTFHRHHQPMNTRDSLWRLCRVFISSSGALLQFDQIQFFCCYNRVQQIFEDWSVDSIKIKDDYTDDGIWDQAAVSRCHMSAYGIDVASFSVAADRRRQRSTVHLSV